MKIVFVVCWSTCLPPRSRRGTFAPGPPQCDRAGKAECGPPISERGCSMRVRVPCKPGETFFGIIFMVNPCGKVLPDVIGEKILFRSAWSRGAAARKTTFFSTPVGRPPIPPAITIGAGMASSSRTPTLSSRDQSSRGVRGQKSPGEWEGEGRGSARTINRWRRISTKPKNPVLASCPGCFTPRPRRLRLLMLANARTPPHCDRGRRAISFIRISLFPDPILFRGSGGVSPPAER